MSTTILAEGNSIIIAPEGRLDADTSPSFTEDALRAVREADSAVIDMENLIYISSAGLRAVLILQKEMNKANGAMTIMNVSPEVMEIFVMTGFDKILKIK